MNDLEKQLLDLRADINNLYWKKDELITNIDLLKKDMSSIKLRRKEITRKLKYVKFNLESLKITSIINAICILVMIIFPNIATTIALLLSTLVFSGNSIYLYSSTPKSKRNIFNFKSIKHFIKSLDLNIIDLVKKELDTQISIDESIELINNISKEINDKKDLEISYINGLYKMDINNDTLVDNKEKKFVKKR